MSNYLIRRTVCSLSLSLLLGLSTGYTTGVAPEYDTNGAKESLRLWVTKTTDTNDGVCDGDCSLREAITAANASEQDVTIHFDRALFKDSHVIQLDGKELSVNKSRGTLTIVGTGADRLTVSGDFRSRVFHIAARARLTLSRLTISGGMTQDEYYGLGGGGIYSQGTLLLSHCTVSDNSTGPSTHSGGGIYNDAGILILDGCLVSNNRVTGGGSPGAGGGIYNEKGVLVITKSTFRGNSVTGGAANYGAGIYSRLGTLELAESLVSDNRVTSGSDSNYGGGIFIEGGWADIRETVVTGNSAKGGRENYGGGIYNAGNVQLSNTTLSENSVGGWHRNRGGGIYHSTGILLLTDCTLVKKVVPGSKNKSYGEDIHSYAQKISRGSTVVYGNTASALHAGPNGKQLDLGNQQISSLAGILLIRKTVKYSIGAEI
jgi:CSLREA domain-containing protein